MGLFFLSLSLSIGCCFVFVFNFISLIFSLLALCILVHAFAYVYECVCVFFTMKYPVYFFPFHSYPSGIPSLIWRTTESQRRRWKVIKILFIFVSCGGEKDAATEVGVLHTDQLRVLNSCKGKMKQTNVMNESAFDTEIFTMPSHAHG